MRQPKRLDSRYPGKCADCGDPIAAGDPILWLRKGTVVCADCDAAHYDAAGNRISAPATGDTKPATPAAGDWAAALAWNSTAPKPGESIGLNPDAIAPAKPDNSRGTCKKCGAEYRFNNLTCHDKGYCTRDCMNAAESQPRIVSQLFRDKRTGEIVETVPVHEIAHFEKYPGNCAPGQFDTPPRKPADAHAASNRLIAAAVKRDPTIAPTVETKPAELNAARVLKTVQADRPELNQAAAIVADMLVTLVNAIDRLDVDQCESIAAHCLHFANETASGSRRRIWQQFARTIH